MSCVLYLVRHGIAAASRPGMSDAARRLTTAGERKLAGVALGLRRLGVAPDAVFSSPLRRAAETAAHLTAALVPAVPVRTCPGLAPGGAFSEIVAALRAHRRARHVMLVGHEPDLGRLASQLLIGSTALQMAFKKGGVAAIEVEALPPQAPGVLRWFLPPKQLRLLGRGR